MPHTDRVAWFARWYETVIPKETRRRGHFASTPKTSKSDGGRDHNALWEGLEVAQREGFAQVGTLGRKRARQHAERSDRTLLEASHELKVPPRHLSKFIRRLGLLPDAKWNGDAHSIDEATFQTLKSIIDDLITLPQTIEITGIPGHEFRPVAQAGFVKEFAGLPIDGVGGPKFRALEVKAFVNRLRVLTADVASNELQTLLSYARANGMGVGELLVAVLRGDITPAGVNVARKGLRALYFAGTS